MMDIGIRGAKFTLGGNEDANMVHLAGCDAYTAYEHFLNGENLRPFLQRIRDMYEETWEAPFLRVLRTFFSYNGGLGRLIPYDRANFFSAIPDYLDLLAEFEFGCLAECLNDTASWEPDFNKQVDLWKRFGLAFAKRPNRLVQVGNETDNAQYQHLDAWRFPSLPGLLTSRGSLLSGEYPMQPFMHFCDYHTRRDGLKGQAACARYLCFVVGGDGESSPPFPGTYRPTIVTEWIRIGDQSIPNYQTNDMGQCYRAGVDAAAWGAGIVVHAYDAMFTRVLSDTQFNCGKAMLKGLSNIYPAFRFGA